MRTCRWPVRAVPIVPTRSNRFPVKRLEHFQKIVEDDVALMFFLRFVPIDKDVGVFQVQVDFHKVRVELKREGNSQYDMLHTPFYFKPKLMGKK